MAEAVRHVLIVAIGAGTAVAGAYFKTNSDQLFMVAAAIIAGEFGLSRTGVTTAVRVGDIPMIRRDV